MWVADAQHSQWPNDEQVLDVLVSLHQRIMSAFHDVPSVGHMGMRRDIGLG